MRPWSVAVQTVCQHGVRLSSVFVMASDRAEAVASGVRTAMGAHEGCEVGVTGTHATELSPVALRAALEQIEARE